MGLLVNIILLIFLVIFEIILFMFVPFLFGAPFEPTRKKKVEKMIKLASIKKGEKVVDLGSGDGRIIIEAAKRGAIAYGFEINPILVLLTKIKIKKENLEGKAYVFWKNFWKQDLSEFDVIMLFQIGYFMGKLEKKLLRELKKGTRIVSHRWKFPNLIPIKNDGDIYLYKI